MRSKRVTSLVLATFLLVASNVPTSLAQLDDCAQPSLVGCPIRINSTVTAVLSNGDDVHLWTVAVSRQQSLHIVLGGLVADYDLHVYATNQALIGESTYDDTRDHVVDVQNPDPGTYLIYVNSARGELSDQPYTLQASSPTSAVTAAQPVAQPV